MFQPRPSQDPDLQTAVDEVLERHHRIEQDGSYIAKGVADIFDFTKNGRKVQLITVANNPLEVILTYQSSAFMSLLSSYTYSPTYSCSDEHHQCEAGSVSLSLRCIADVMGLVYDLPQ